MKVVMINDCAFVGETLLKYLPPELEKQHIKRSRNFWDKTFGIASKILKAKGNIYHVNYLLQDCYLASRLGKQPLIGHAHGSDLKVGLRHLLWRRLIIHNLLRCNKILVSTPDLLKIAKQYRMDAEYLPNPVDGTWFFPKPLWSRNRKKKVLIASKSDWTVKGTDIIIKALSRIKHQVEVSMIKYGEDFEATLALASSIGLKVNILPKVPHRKIREYFWAHDIVIDQFKAGALGMIALEAIASGRPVITYVSSEYPEYKDFPIKNVDSEDKILDAMRFSPEKLWRDENAYLRKHHKAEEIAKKLFFVYKNMV